MLGVQEREKKKPHPQHCFACSHPGGQHSSRWPGATEKRFQCVLQFNNSRQILVTVFTKMVKKKTQHLKRMYLLPRLFSYVEGLSARSCCTNKTLLNLELELLPSKYQFLFNFRQTMIVDSNHINLEIQFISIKFNLYHLIHIIIKETVLVDTEKLEV